MCLNRVLIFVLVMAVGALALALVGMSAVAVIAQVSALASQCLLAVALLGISGALVAQIALRNRVVQVLVARKLLGDEADRVLQQGALASPQQAQLMAPLEQPQAQMMYRSRQPVERKIIPPVVPIGWGFGAEYGGADYSGDEE